MSKDLVGRSSDSSGEAPELGRLLRHYDPRQLFFQIAEIVDGRAYLRHGIQVGDGDVVVDVGANVGVAAAFFAAHCGAGAVHSFEPIPAVFEQLAENLRCFPTCVAYPYGLGDAERTVEMTFYPRAAAMSGAYADPAGDRSRVRTYMLNAGFNEEEADAELMDLFAGTPVLARLRRLSSVILEQGIDRVDLLKIDVEKAELDVLAGIDDGHWPLIRQLVAEVHDEGGRLDWLRANLRKRGFEVQTSQEPEWRSTSVHMLFASRR